MQRHTQMPSRIGDRFDCRLSPMCDDGEALLLRAHPRVRRGTTSSRPPRYATTQCARWGACYRIVNESASRLKRARGEGHRLSRSP